jgi:cytidylate kinase
LDSRLGFYAQPEAFKILLDVDEEEAGKRIFAAQRGTDQFKNEEEAVQNVKERNQADADRYVRLYDLQVWDYKNYSLVIDTTERTPEEVVEIILKEFEARKQKKLQENPKLYGFLKEEIKEDSDKEHSEGKSEKEEKSE